eukprot:5398477-Amphidinium_carterae.1
MQKHQVFIQEHINNIPSEDIKKVVKTRWVINRRPGQQGTSRVKCKWCAKGYSQHIRDPDLDLFINTIIIDLVHRAHHFTLHEVVIMGFRHQLSISLDT